MCIIYWPEHIFDPSATIRASNYKQVRSPAVDSGQFGYRIFMTGYLLPSGLSVDLLWDVQHELECTQGDRRRRIIAVAPTPATSRFRGARSASLLQAFVYVVLRDRVQPVAANQTGVED